MTDITSNSASSPGRRIIRIRVLGVGGAGCNAVEQMAALPLEGVDYTVLNTDQAALQRVTHANRQLLGPQTTRGLGAGGEPERGRKAAEEDAQMLRQLCDGADLVFIVAGMGGGTGTGAAPVVARIAREAGALAVAIAITPFHCEGVHRQKRAALGLQTLRAASDSVICLPNEKILAALDEKTQLSDALRQVNEWGIQGVQGIWRILSSPGLINADFADLCAVLRGQHSDSALACSDARGESRLPAAMDKLFAHPLIEGGAGLSDANQMLVSICGGPDLTMRDVNHVMEQLGRQAPQANLTLGASVQADFHERIAITIVASGFAAKRAPEGDSVQVSPGVIVSLSTPPTVASESDPLLREADLSKESRPPSRFVAPPPESAPELVQAMARQPGLGGLRKPGVWKQGTLNLEIISRGRFERSEPTIYGGEDLDVPTFVRRGITLN